MTGTTPATPAPTPAPTPVPHKHSWTPIYETRTTTVVVTPEWFEPEYMMVPIYDTVHKCRDCDYTSVGNDTDAYQHSMLNSHNVDGTTEIIGYETYETGMSIWHPAVTEERTEQVIVGYTCGCGAMK